MFSKHQVYIYWVHNNSIIDKNQLFRCTMIESKHKYHVQIIYFKIIRLIWLSYLNFRIELNNIDNNLTNVKVILIYANKI